MLDDEWSSLTILILYSINHITEERTTFESLPLGVDNMSNYVEISSWSVIVLCKCQWTIVFSLNNITVVWITSLQKTVMAKQLPWAPPQAYPSPATLSSTKLWESVWICKMNIQDGWIFMVSIRKCWKVSIDSIEVLSWSLLKLPHCRVHRS